MRARRSQIMWRHSKGRKQQGDCRSGVSLMRFQKHTRRHVTLLFAALIGSLASPCLAQTDAGGTLAEWINKLAGLETVPDLDIAALRQQVAERVKSKADGVPIKRPPVAPELTR